MNSFYIKTLNYTPSSAVHYGYVEARGIWEKKIKL